MEAYDLAQAIAYKHLLFKIPLAAMRDVGAASQTLAGLLTITHKETFVALEQIAGAARVPKPTARKHLAKLVERGWVKHKGRGHTRSGAPRRTVTYRITKKSLDALGEYAVLPWFFRIDSMSWPERAVLSVILSRIMSLRSVVSVQFDEDASHLEELLEAIDDLGGEGRFKFTIRGLMDLTGLSRPSVLSAKMELSKRGIIRLVSDDRHDGGTPADLLVPNPLFRVQIRNCETPGKCYIYYKDLTEVVESLRRGVGQKAGTPG